MARALDPASVRRFYDRFGSAQDRQAFYEDPGLDALIHEAGFGGARRVFEFGCGTGRLYALRPGLVGGCRPIAVVDFLEASYWRRRHHGVVVAWAVPSEVLVAEAA